jgi:type I restriction enzyme S subunit
MQSPKKQLQIEQASRYLMTKANQQQRIATCLSRLDALIAAQTQKLKALKTHKRGLMQQLFPSLEVA